MENKWMDLRSDTVTKPTAGMMDAMMNAVVGDDVFGEDETVNKLQNYAANLFGMEAALFCSSGTQTNQIAIKLHTQPGDEVICDQLAHVYLYEGGGMAFNSGVSVRLTHGERGIFTTTQVVDNINKEDVHFPASKLVCVENTMNKGGGACWDLVELQKIKEVCIEHKMAFHLDGARLFNAMQAKQQQPQDFGSIFDTISICLSKGLGAPVGSLLLGTEANIYKARRLRKILGGGMRQAGFIAAAGLYALQNNVERLGEDHKNAKAIGELLTQKEYVEYVLPIETNIVIFKIHDGYSVIQFTELLAKNQIKAVSMGKNIVRFVFHLENTESHLDRLKQCLNTYR